MPDTPQNTSTTPPAAQKPQEPVRFRSDVRNLILQGGKGDPWAEFVDHEFITDDPKVIARLADVAGVSKVDDEPTES